MLPTIKNICSLLNNENAPVEYYTWDKDSPRSPVMSLVTISEERRKEYEALPTELKKKYVSDSAHLIMPTVNVEALSDIFSFNPLHNVLYSDPTDGIIFDYEFTLEHINKIIPVSDNNEKFLFATYLVLHELGHWNDFVSKNKIHYLYLDPSAYKKANEVKEQVMKKRRELKHKSRDRVKLMDSKRFTEYYNVPCENRANKYADRRLCEAYEIILHHFDI